MGVHGSNTRVFLISQQPLRNGASGSSKKAPYRRDGVELIGTIEPGATAAFGNAEWIRVIEAHPQLSPMPDKRGVNPFLRKPTQYQSNRTTAQVVIDGSQIGSIHWAMDDSRLLVVWSNTGTEEKVEGVAMDVAGRLGWRFVRGSAIGAKVV